MLATTERAYDRTVTTRKRHSPIARRSSGTTHRLVRPVLTVVITAALVGAGGCIGRGKTESTGPVRNAPTAAARADFARTPVEGQCRKGVTPDFAAQHVNESETVVGAVVAVQHDTATPDAPTYLELGAAYPAAGSLSIAILASVVGNFPAPPGQLYNGKTICVIGVVQNYMQRKAIIVGSPEGIAVVSDFGGSATP